MTNGLDLASKSPALKILVVQPRNVMRGKNSKKMKIYIHLLTACMYCEKNQYGDCDKMGGKTIDVDSSVTFPSWCPLLDTEDITDNDEMKDCSPFYYTIDKGNLRERILKKY